MKYFTKFLSLFFAAAMLLRKSFRVFSACPFGQAED